MESEMYCCQAVMKLTATAVQKLHCKIHIHVDYNVGGVMFVKRHKLLGIASFISSESELRSYFI